MSRDLRIVSLTALLILSLPAGAFGQTYLFGGPGSLEGRFEDEGGNFDSQGWSGVRCTPDDVYWQVDTFQASNLNGHGMGNHALWCGRSAAQQPDWDAAPGYGNSWLAAAEWRGVVPDPASAVTVEFEFYYNHDSEPAYDFFLVDWHDGTSWQNLLVLDGTNKNAGSFDPPGEHFLQNWVIQPSEFTGPDQDEVRLRLLFFSDGGVSDADPLLGFDSDGAVQVDDIMVSFDGTPVDGGGDSDGVATFEDGDDEGWTPMGSPCTCPILTMLPAEYDPSLSNPTPVLGRILDTSLRFAASCGFTSPEFGWTLPGSPDGAFVDFDTFFYSDGRPGFIYYQVNVSWREGGVWQPAQGVFVGEVPVAGWQSFHVDFSGVVPSTAEAVRVTFAPNYGDGLLEIFAVDNVAVGRSDTAVAAPAVSSRTALLGVHPNPANPRATVAFQLEHPGPVELSVYDLRGRKLRTLMDQVMDAGPHEVVFDGRDADGRSLASGTYFVRLETRSEIASRRLTLVK